MRIGRNFFRFSARSQYGSFGSQYLGLRLEADGGCVSIVSEDVITARLPAWCTRRDGRPPLAALIALLDEASTATVAMRDRSGRFGVSVDLSGVVATDAPKIDAETTLTFRTTPRRIGKTLAFADVDVFANGSLVLKGHHIKFLPSGFIMDNVDHPLMRPVVEAVVSRLPLGEKRLEGEDPFAGMTVTTKICNPLGGLHGGAACMIAERAASSSTDNQLFPSAMRVTLMASAKPGSGLEVTTEDGARDSDQTVTISSSSSGSSRLHSQKKSTEAVRANVQFSRLL